MIMYKLKTKYLSVLLMCGIVFTNNPSVSMERDLSINKVNNFSINTGRFYNIENLNYKQFNCFNTVYKNYMFYDFVCNNGSSIVNTMLNIRNAGSRKTTNAKYYGKCNEDWNFWNAIKNRLEESGLNYVVPSVQWAPLCNNLIDKIHSYNGERLRRLIEKIKETRIPNIVSQEDVIAWNYRVLEANYLRHIICTHINKNNQVANACLEDLEEYLYWAITKYQQCFCKYYDYIIDHFSNNDNVQKIVPNLIKLLTLISCPIRFYINSNDPYSNNSDSVYGIAILSPLGIGFEVQLIRKLAHKDISEIKPSSKGTLQNEFKDLSQFKTIVGFKRKNNTPLKLTLESEENDNTLFKLMCYNADEIEQTEVNSWALPLPEHVKSFQRILKGRNSDGSRRNLSTVFMLCSNPTGVRNAKGDVEAIQKSLYKDIVQYMKEHLPQNTEIDTPQKFDEKVYELYSEP